MRRRPGRATGTASPPRRTGPRRPPPSAKPRRQARARLSGRQARTSPAACRRRRLPGAAGAAPAASASRLPLWRPQPRGQGRPRRCWRRTRHSCWPAEPAPPWGRAATPTPPPWPLSTLRLAGQLTANCPTSWPLSTTPCTTEQSPGRAGPDRLCRTRWARCCRLACWQTASAWTTASMQQIARRPRRRMTWTRGCATDGAGDTGPRPRRPRQRRQAEAPTQPAATLLLPLLPPRGAWPPRRSPQPGTRRSAGRWPSRAW
mmetsp:Transcript_18577/g.70513  ORF Transcript_18577/g.70513 Transcript_18577/m.70513 type:complete len:260 (+) Transcript_18577:1129-1908(+)